MEKTLLEKVADSVWKQTALTEPFPCPPNVEALIRKSYMREVAAKGTCNIAIADVLDPLALNMGDAKRYIAHLWKRGAIIELPSGDWSLSDDRTRAWGVRVFHEFPSLLMRMEPVF